MKSIFGKLFLLAVCLAVVSPAMAAPADATIDASVLNNVSTINPFTLSTVKTQSAGSVTVLMGSMTTMAKAGPRSYSLADGTTVTLRPKQIILPYKPIFRTPWCLNNNVD